MRKARRGSATLRRVLIATRAFPPDAGAASHRWAVWASALANSATSVEVLTSRAARSGPDGMPSNVTVSRWPVLRAADGTVRGYAQYLSFDIPLFFRLLTAPRPSVILCEPPPTTGAVTRIVCALRSIPYVYSASDLLAAAAQAQGVAAPVVAAVRWLERFALRGAAEVIAVSLPVADAVLAVAGRPPVVIPHAAALSPVPDGPADSEGVVFLYAGTAADGMGADVFVKAAPLVLEQLPNAQFEFMGYGTGWDDLVAQISALDDSRVRLVPPCDTAEARQREAAATATMAALAPGAYEYAYTTKVLTSLASGTPVVYAGVGPAAEDIIRGQLGIVVAQDPAQVAASLIEIARAVEAGEEWVRPDRLRAWVDEHRSAKASGRAVVGVAQRAAAR